MKVSVPLYITLPRKTKKDKLIRLNLNWYRNVHYRTSNDVKKLFKESVRPYLEGKKFDKEYGLIVTIFYSRMSDLDNWDSVIVKFFNDALQELGCVEEDNMDHCKFKIGLVGGKDTKNPRAEIDIVNLNQSKYEQIADTVNRLTSD